jgi:acyl-CoA synthetase (AMP-forming)/AMP-acid ligase II
VAGAATRSTDFPAFTPTTGTLTRWCAERWGDRTFVVLGDERLTYDEADARSARLAKGLLASGVGKGTRVGLLAPNGPGWVVAWLAATRVGAVATLLSTYAKARELAWTARHADVQVLFTVDTHLSNDYLARLEEAAPDLAAQSAERILVPSLPYLRSVWVWGGGGTGRAWVGRVDELADRGDAVDDPLLAAVEAEVTPGDPAVVVYTSGSTAAPKGAVHGHGAMVRHAHNLGQLRDLDGDDVLYSSMPLFWVGGFSYTLVAAMHVGATVVFESRFEPGATLDLLERERVTQVLGWPHMTKELADHPSFRDHDLSAVRRGPLADLIHGDEGDEGTGAGPGAAAATGSSLGMTETLGPHTYSEPDPAPGAAGAAASANFGSPVPGVEHKVVDPVTLAEVPVGESGELWVRGYSLMLGMHKRERSETFTADGWYRTGDGGWFDDEGHFHFTGRMGDLIKSSGMNITPREVELALEELPEVALAFVAGIDHPLRGQDVVAAVALRPGESLDEDEIRARLKADVASYKVPRRMAVFTAQSELPWLDSGKLDRRRLVTLLADRFGES